MIIYAFSTLGKTYLTKLNKGQCWDFAVNRISKQLGYDEYKEDDADLNNKLALLVANNKRLFKHIFISIPSKTMFRYLKSQGLVVVLPKFGVKEFKRRLIDRYQSKWMFSDEWLYLGDKYASRIREIFSWCRNLGIPVYFADHLSDVIHS